MEIDKELLLREADAAGIPREQAALLWTRLSLLGGRTATNTPSAASISRFDSLHVAYYSPWLFMD